MARLVHKGVDHPVGHASEPHYVWDTRRLNRTSRPVTPVKATAPALAGLDAYSAIAWTESGTRIVGTSDSGAA